MGYTIAFIIIVCLVLFGIFMGCLSLAKKSDEEMDRMYKEHQKRANEVIDKLSRKKRS